MNEIVKHDTNFPPSASAGGDNAYYLKDCRTLERPAAYAACLSRLTDIDAGRTNERTAECSKSLREGRCIAAGMREQEQLAGAALFYFPRNISKPFLPAKVAGDFGVLITNLTDPALIPASTRPRPIGTAPAAPAKPKSIMDTIDSGSYVDAINTAKAKSFLERTHETFAAAVERNADELKRTESGPLAGTPKKAITKDDLAKLALPGESLIETAKRLLNKTKEAAHAI